MPDESALSSHNFDLVFVVEGCDEIGRVDFCDFGEDCRDGEFGLHVGRFLNGFREVFRCRLSMTILRELFWDFELRLK